MNRRRLLIFGIPLAGLAVVLMGVNPVVESTLNRYLQNKLRFEKDSSTYRISYTDLDLNIYKKEFQLSGLKILSLSESDSSGQERDQGLLREMRIAKARIAGVNLTNFLWDRSLEINGVDLDSVSLTFLKPDARAERQKDREERAVLDSLKLPGINSIKLGDVGVGHFTLHVLDAADADTISSYRSEDLRIHGVGLSQNGAGRSHTFTPELENLVFRLGEQQYHLGNGLYTIAYDSLLYIHREESLRIDKLRIEPRVSVDSFATRHAGKNYQRMNLGLHALRIEGLGLHRIISSGTLDLQKLEIDSLQAEIYKDGSHPIDPDLDIPLPTRLLEGLEVNLSVDTLRYNGPRLSIYEKLPDASRHLETYLTGLKGEIRNIRSASWALDPDEPLQIDFQADLLGAIALAVSIEMPYGADALFFHGSTSGSSELASLNPTMIPAMNMRFGEGRLHGITFQARGNSQHVQGELTMLYSDLEVELLKPDQSEKRALTWVANAVVKNSNPNRRGRTLTAEISAERDPTKGLGAYVMKGVHSGIVNTFNPLGKNSRD